MSRRTVGLLVKGDAVWAEEAYEAAKARLLPWKDGYCCHYQEPCSCPGWKFDLPPSPEVILTADLAREGDDHTCLLRLDGIASWVNLHDEWYDRWDCTDFDQVVRADLQRVYGQWDHVVVIFRIHYIAL